MIPTLFGVTLVSFVIMQLAPGDPMLAQIDSGGSAGQSTQTREAFLIQKRDLKLDKPILLNFNDFRNYRGPIRTCAHYLSLTPEQIAEELPQLNGKSPSAVERERLKFLESLPIKGFRSKLASVQQQAPLAIAILAYVRTYCEDTGSHGVEAAITILESDADLHEKIGAIRALEFMVPDPFEYTFSRTPLAEEAPQVELTWRIWWKRNEDKFAALDPDRYKVLEEQLAAMVAEPSREKLFEQLENYDRDDTPFFVGVLLGDRPLKEKSIAAMFLLLYNNKPLAVDVPLDATAEQVERVSENWQAHYEANRDKYQVGAARKLWNVVADTQYAHMVWRLVTFDFGRSALKTREPVSEKLWNAVVVSAPLMIMAEIIIYLVAVPLGIVCAVNRGKVTDRLISLGLFLLYSVPAFVAAMLFLLFFCYGDYLKLFPMERLHSENADSLGPVSYFLDYLWHAALPVTCLALFSLAGLAMYSRSSMLDVINQDYVRTARAKGLSQRVIILKHVLRNGMISIITLFSGFLPAMLGGSVLVEVLFNIPGMGRLSFSSIEQKDFPTQMALIYVDAIVVMLSILLTDVLYVLVDPRISFESQGGEK
jgi:peptide/nickel transport system permease protein